MQRRRKEGEKKGTYFGSKLEGGKGGGRIRCSRGNSGPASLGEVHSHFGEKSEKTGGGGSGSQSGGEGKEKDSGVRKKRRLRSSVRRGVIKRPSLRAISCARKKRKDALLCRDEKTQTSTEKKEGNLPATTLSQHGKRRERAQVPSSAKREKPW